MTRRNVTNVTRPDGGQRESVLARRRAWLALGAAAVMTFAAAPARAATTYTVIDLGDLPGGIDQSYAFGINDSSQVVGYSYAATGRPRAFLWDSGVMTDLGDLPGGGVYSAAEDINASGQVVGRSGAATGYRAFLWDSGVMTDLGDLPGGLDDSFAFGINASGQVVGRSEAAGGQRAFVWDSTDGMLDLNTLLDASGTGWTLFEARDINDSGWIVGTGINPDGYTRSFLAIPEPATLSLLVLGGLAVMRRRRR